MSDDLPYTPTDKPWTIDGITCYRELQSPEVVHKDACFFAYTGSVNGDVFRREFKDDVISLSYREQGWGVGSDYRHQIPFPFQVKGWEYNFYEFPPEAIAPHLSDFSIAGDRAHWYCDFQATHLGLIVTERARAVIEEIDPGMNYFFPVNITIRETGEPLPEARYYWKPRREMRCLLPPSGTGEGYYTGPFRRGGTFRVPSIGWELKTNEPLRNFLNTLPFWTLWVRNFNFGMSPDVYVRLKAEGFTGLIEIIGDDIDAPGFDKNANIGHF